MEGRCWLIPMIDCLFPALEFWIPASEFHKKCSVIARLKLELNAMVTIELASPWEQRIDSEIWKKAEKKILHKRH